MGLVPLCEGVDLYRYLIDVSIKWRHCGGQVTRAGARTRTQFF